LLVILLVCCLAGIAAVFAGPVSSGAILLLLPGDRSPSDHQAPVSDQPLHKGYVNLDSGYYIREDEDLIVPGAPALTLRRTYISNYHASKQFGVGATHNGEVYLIGDGVRFQSAALILATGHRIKFARVSPGTTYWNALYEHNASGGEWLGARLGWTGGSWALRRIDGSLSVFKGCGRADSCSILTARDADGHTTKYRRDGEGRLLRMEAGAAWIAFDYDSANRVVRAYDSLQRQVRYDYDADGRLSRVVGHDGAVRRYTYTAKDQLATIVEPGTDIENIYDDADGRCIRQINRVPDAKDAEPYVFDFTYQVEGGEVVQSRTSRSDGTWSRYTFDKGYTIAETWGRTGQEPASFTYDRDATTNAITALTVTCPDRTGRPLRHSNVVTNGNEEWIKWDVLRTHCSWRRPPASGSAAPPLNPE
jgi:YD repeat-containing protein